MAVVRVLKVEAREVPTDEFLKGLEGPLPFKDWRVALEANSTLSLSLLLMSVGLLALESPSRR